GSASGVSNNSDAAAPYWLRLVRTGDLFTSYISADGANWIQSGATTVAMNSTVYVGLAVCSVADGTLCKAQFDNISFSSAASVVVTSPLPTLIHRYSFNETTGSVAHDAVGSADGTLHGTASFDGNGQVVLDGSSGAYVSLPANLLAGLSNVTIDAWVSFSVPNNNVHLFSMGDGDGDGSGGNYLRYNLYDTGHGHGGTNFFETLISWGGNLLHGGDVLPMNNPVHVTLIYDPANGVKTIYINGELSSAYNGSLAALDSYPENVFYLGRSPWDSDPYLNGSINEFRIYSGVLQPADISASETVGANVLLTTNASINISQGSSSLTMNWPVAASGFTLQCSSSLGANAVWTTVTNAMTIMGASNQLTMPLTNTAMYFRLRR
ncbi:MAG TPA: LamG-like jellyroll fold domain-containing protein, partial [Verrucomicrobiae bacterium]